MHTQSLANIISTMLLWTTLSSLSSSSSFLHSLQQLPVDFLFIPLLPGFSFLAILFPLYLLISSFMTFFNPVLVEIYFHLPWTYFPVIDCQPVQVIFHFFPSAKWEKKKRKTLGLPFHSSFSLTSLEVLHQQRIFMCTSSSENPVMNYYVIFALRHIFYFTYIAL